MDTGAAGNRRFSRIGTTPAVGRIAGGKATEIAPSEAVAAMGSATQSDHKPTPQTGDERERSSADRYALAAEAQQALLEAADGAQADDAWRIPGAALSALYREWERSLPNQAASPSPEGSQPETGDSTPTPSEAGNGRTV